MIELEDGTYKIEDISEITSIRLLLWARKDTDGSYVILSFVIMHTPKPSPGQESELYAADRKYFRLTEEQFDQLCERQPYNLPQLSEKLYEKGFNS